MEVSLALQLVYVFASAESDVKIRLSDVENAMVSYHYHTIQWYAYQVGMHEFDLARHVKSHNFSN